MINETLERIGRDKKHENMLHLDMLTAAGLVAAGQQDMYNRLHEGFMTDEDKLYMDELEKKRIREKKEQGGGIPKRRRAKPSGENTTE